MRHRSRALAERRRYLLSGGGLGFTFVPTFGSCVFFSTCIRTRREFLRKLYFSQRLLQPSTVPPSVPVSVISVGKPSALEPIVGVVVVVVTKVVADFLPVLLLRMMTVEESVVWLTEFNTAASAVVVAVGAYKSLTMTDRQSAG